MIEVIEKVQQFLRETWELWYWAMFCPSKLQKRMNEWKHQPETEGKILDIDFYFLIFRNYEFVSKFLLIIFVFCLPLLWMISIIYFQSSTTSSMTYFELCFFWGGILILILLGQLIIAYSVSILFLPIGLHLPLVLNLVYFGNPRTFTNSLKIAFSILPPIPQLATGLGIGFMALSITLSIGNWLFKQNCPSLARNITLAGTVLSVMIGIEQASQNWSLAILAGGLAGGLTVFWLLSIFFLRNQIDFDRFSPVSIAIFFVEVVVGFVVGFSMGFVVAGFATGVAAGVIVSLLNIAVITALTITLTDVVLMPVSMFVARFAGMFFVDLLIGGSIIFILMIISIIILIIILLIVFNYIIPYILGFLVGVVVAHIVVDLMPRVVALLVGVITGVATVVFITYIIFLLQIGILYFTMPIAIFVALRVILDWVENGLDSPRNALTNAVSNVVFNVAKSIVFFVTTSVTISVAMGVGAIVLGSMGALPLPFLLMAIWLLAFSFSPARSHWWAFLLSGMSIALGFPNLSWNVLLVIPAVLLGYYRIFPDYLVLSLMSLLPLIPANKRFGLQLLRLLPPHSSELLWLPLPNQDRLLFSACRTNAEVFIDTFQQMQASPFPGFKPTIKKALPQILAHQLTVIRTTDELIASATLKHPILPLLIPNFYQLAVEPETPAKESEFLQYIKPEISIVVPRLQKIARDVGAALKGGSAAIRERGLERIINNLSRLEGQLPGLGLKSQEIQCWQPVFDCWQQVIEAELQEQRNQSQGELLNPFQYGNPLRNDRSNLFKGRQEFADNIVRLILDRNRPTLVLHGARRFGKSSFLLNLPSLLPSEVIPVYLDLQSAAVTTDEASFCQGLVRAIHRDSRSQGIELPAPPPRQEFIQTPYIVLEDWLDLAMPKLSEQRLLLNLDEFEKIGAAIQEGRLSLQLFDELRSLIQHWDRLGFLFSGVQTLDKLGPNWSSYFISVVPIEMSYLQPNEAKDLLINPDPDFALGYDTGIVAEIIRLTRCHPYLLQLLGSALVTQANLHHTKLVTTDLLKAAIQDSFTLGEPYFINVWTEFTGSSPAEVTAGQRLLLKMVHRGEDGLMAEDEVLAAAVRRMRRYRVLDREGSDRFEVPLMEMWVRARAVPTK